MKAYFKSFSFPQSLSGLLHLMLTNKNTQIYNIKSFHHSCDTFLCVSVFFFVKAIMGGCLDC